jgi:hypothetical protein
MATPVVRKLIQLPVPLSERFDEFARDNPQAVPKGFSQFMVNLLERALHVKPGTYVSR